MKKVNKILLSSIICVLILTVAVVAIICARKTSVPTSDDVNSTMNSLSIANAMGFNIDIPTEEEALKINIKNKLLEEQFVKYNIELTDEEADYAKNYLDNFMKAVNEDIANGGPTKESNEKTLEALNQYLQQMNITMEEYALLVEQQLIFQTKYQKLIQQQYNGDKQALDAVLDKEVEKVYDETYELYQTEKAEK